MITGIMDLATLAILLHSFFICHDDLKSQTHHTVTSLTIAALLLPLLFLFTLFCRSGSILQIWQCVDLVKK
jgi:hypothetical protein